MILSAAVYWQARLPDEYALTRGGSLRLPGNITAVYGEETAVARSGEATAGAQLRLPLGGIPCWSPAVPSASRCLPRD